MDRRGWRLGAIRLSRPSERVGVLLMRDLPRLLSRLLHQLAGRGQTLWTWLVTSVRAYGPRLSAGVQALARSSHASMLLLGAMGLLISLVSGWRVTALERERAQSVFAEASRDRVLVIERAISYTLGVVRDLGSFFDASPQVSRRQFREFVGPALKHNPWIVALEWVPRVFDRQREAFLTQARISYPRFRIFDNPAAEDQREPVPRSEVYPVLYLQPYVRNKLVLGLDLGSIPEELDALQRAASSERLDVSFSRTYFNDQGAVTGFAAYLPLYDRPDQRDGTEGDEGEEKRGETPKGALRGFVIGRFALGTLIENALQTLGPAGVEMDFYAPEISGESELLYTHPSRLAGTSPTLRTVPHPLKTETDSIEVGSQALRVVSRPLPGSFEPESWGGVLVVVGGLAFTVLSLVYLFTLLGQKEQIKRLVAQRTRELEHSNAALNIEVGERRRAERALQRLNATLEQRVARRTGEAERRARELEQFAYVASHDLKAPLRGVSNLAAWLAEDLEGKLTPETGEQLNLLRDRVARMHALIEGLLTYSRIGRTQGNVEMVDTGQLVADTIDSLAPPMGFRVEVAPGMPSLHTDRLHLGQVFANLISNGIKHHHRNSGTIGVRGRDLNSHCEFEVSDDGPGIAPQYQDKVFLMFQTLNVKDHEGDTGIGLALVKKLVEEHGGTITLDSAPGRGSRFRFTWAKQSPETPATMHSEGEA